MEYQHTPVMLLEVLAALRPKRGEYFIDGTLGGGGYTAALSGAVGQKGKVLAIDLDEKAIGNTARKNLKNVVLVQDNFGNLTKIISDNFPGGEQFDGFVLDLGLSSFQLSDERRGFSFRSDTPLDMAFDSAGADERTRNIVNHWREADLAEIISSYGEEKFARRIAKAIVAVRREGPIRTTGELSEIVKKSIPRKFWAENIHPATRTFQALRIATNRELESLEKVLPAVLGVLKPGGRIVIVSFHSLEDRIVKDFFKREARECLCPPELPVCRCGHRKMLKIITSKPLEPSEKEKSENPRSRSAKLRVAEKI